MLEHFQAQFPDPQKSPFLAHHRELLEMLGPSRFFRIPADSLGLVRFAAGGSFSPAKVVTTIEGHPGTFFLKQTSLSEAYQCESAALAIRQRQGNIPQPYKIFEIGYHGIFGILMPDLSQNGQKFVFSANDTHLSTQIHSPRTPPNSSSITLIGLSLLTIAHAASGISPLGQLVFPPDYTNEPKRHQYSISLEPTVFTFVRDRAGQIESVYATDFCGNSGNPHNSFLSERYFYPSNDGYFPPTDHLLFNFITCHSLF